MGSGTSTAIPAPAPAPSLNAPAPAPPKKAPAAPVPAPAPVSAPQPAPAPAPLSPPKADRAPISKPAPVEETLSLKQAAVRGNQTAARRAIAAHASVHEADEHSWTPLIHAAFHGHAPLIPILLNEGATLNAKDAEGWTAFMWAAWKNNGAVVHALADAGADVNAADRHGNTALMWVSTVSGNGVMLQRLVKMGARINAANYLGKTAIMAAALENNSEGVTYLLQLGANVELADKSGWVAKDMPLIAAALRNTELAAINQAAAAQSVPSPKLANKSPVLQPAAAVMKEESQPLARDITPPNATMQEQQGDTESAAVHDMLTPVPAAPQSSEGNNKAEMEEGEERQDSAAAQAQGPSTTHPDPNKIDGDDITASSDTVWSTGDAEERSGEEGAHDNTQLTTVVSS